MKKLPNIFPLLSLKQHHYNLYIRSFIFLIPYLIFILQGCKPDEPNLAPQNPTTEVVEVKSKTGRIWMDRNLGATEVAIKSGDNLAFGDLYQWGRPSDGHQKRNSITTDVKASNNTPGNVGFIIGRDWRRVANATNLDLWNGVKGANNPCPKGFRLPTEEEWKAELPFWGQGIGGLNDDTGALNSSLKLPIGGYRNPEDGELKNVRSQVFYWTSSTKDEFSVALMILNNGSYFMVNLYRATGGCVRCIKN